MKVRILLAAAIGAIFILYGCFSLKPEQHITLRFTPQGKEICTALLIWENCKKFSPPPSAHFSKSNWRFKKCWSKQAEDEYVLNGSCQKF